VKKARLGLSRFLQAGRRLCPTSFAYYLLLVITCLNYLL
jgi:hypothetical protein